MADALGIYRGALTQTKGAYNDSHEGILELLVLHLGVDVNSRQPASVAGMGMVPSNGILQATDLGIGKLTK
jgi:hypothetical protein